MFSNENRMANNSNNSKRRNYRKNVQDSSHSSEIFQINSHLPEKCVYDDDPPNYTYISLFGTVCYARCCVRTITSRQRRARECRQSFRAAEGPLKPLILLVLYGSTRTALFHHLIDEVSAPAMLLHQRDDKVTTRWVE